MLIGYCSNQTSTESGNQPIYSLSDEPLVSSVPTQKIVDQLAEKEKVYRAEPDSADNVIWYGRFLAYAGEYEKAIAIFSEGIEKFPEDARFYRHRGHRFITIRKLDDALNDLEKASELIEGKINEVEPDGMPNVQNIPVSTLHGNIWYHQGLAYYLKHNFAKALVAFINCIRSGNNDDNLVSATHWVYTIMCRINKNYDLEKILSRISDNMNVIENTGYYRLCRLYQGELTVEEVTRGIGEGPAQDAVDYGIARWYACQGDSVKSQEILNDIVKRPGWASFGYIAAEADLYHQQVK
jgi:tetratricopeptide (TPR) repeat protein